jgi:hypothetical protein
VERAIDRAYGPRRLRYLKLRAERRAPRSIRFRRAGASAD